MLVLWKLFLPLFNGEKNAISLVQYSRITEYKQENIL